MEKIATMEGGSPPWVGLGTRVGRLSPDQMRIKAGLDWEVEKVPNFRAIHKRGHAVEFEEIPDGFHLERTSDRRILSPHVGSRYKPVQPADAFQLFHDYVKAGGMTMETAGSLKDGKIIWALARINHGFTLPGGDEVNGYLLLSESYEYGNTLKAMFTTIRVIDWNTYIEALNGAGSRGMFQMSHSRTFDDSVIEEIKHTMTIANAMIDDIGEKARFLSKVNFTEARGVEFLVRVYDDPLLKTMKKKGLSLDSLPQSIDDAACEIALNTTTKNVLNLVHEQPGADLPTKNSAWAWFNAVIYAQDHVLGHGQDTRLQSSWFGKGAQVKRHAFDTALKMAKRIS